MTSAIIEVENLTKRYGDVQALRGVSFAVQEGEVFGLLGPNGAGKTSTVEILEGLRPADGGRVQRLRPGPANQRRRLQTKDRSRTAIHGAARQNSRRGSAGDCSPASTTTAGTPAGCSSVSGWKKSAAPSTPNSPADKSSGWPWRCPW